MKTVSIRKLALGMFLFVLLPMSFVIIISSVLRVMDQREKAFQEQANLLRITAVSVRNELQRVETAMEQITGNNVAARSLSVPSPTAQISINTYVIRTAMDTLFTTSPDLSMMMFYCPQTNIMIAKDDGFVDWKAVNKTSLISQIKATYIKQVQSGQTIKDDWYIQEAGNRYFVCRSVSYEDIYCSVLFDLQGILQQLAEGDTVTCWSFYDQDVLLAQWPKQDPSAQSQEKQFVPAITVRENLAGIVLERTTIADTYFYGVDVLTVALVSLSFLLVILLGILILIWQRQFLRPMNRLIGTMQEISSGDLSARAELTGAGEELRLVNRTFNTMLERIQKLKIEKYEQEISVRQTKLQYYQAQIRPHFYLNCLKNLYSLAQQNEMQNIEESILLLSNHLRYCFQWHTEMVTLRHELEMCRNYIDLMGVTAVLKPQLRLDVDAEVLQCEIPPVSILTLVENSMKYGLNDRKQSIIRIKAGWLEGEDITYLQIGVYDNGPGFTAQQLEVLNGLIDKQSAEESGHVGVRNVMTRFQLLYDNRFDAAFSNQGGGAVELFIEQEKNPERKIP